MASLTTLGDEALIALDTLSDRASGVFYPTVRLGVTGLSRAGKSVFITALVHNLIHGGRLPLFDVAHNNRLARAYLEPQPDDGVPRFAYEEHVKALIDERNWPDSTRSVSQLRLTLEYESASGWNRLFAGGKLHLDIVDYPGEWLLDLPLLGKDYSTFSRESIDRAKGVQRDEIATDFLKLAAEIDPSAPADETAIRTLSEAFKEYLAACRSETLSLSTLPPGRFLMPGDMEGSPALTFAPLLNVNEKATANSNQAMMERRYEAYKKLVVRPFFREHITRLDRQIVLVDAMQAINAGPEALADLERALVDIMTCFRPGAGNLLTSLWQRKIDKILIAATKADHLHHESHDRLEAIVQRLVQRATKTARFSSATIDAVALAAVRATKEAAITEKGDTLPVVVGTPLKGERLDGQIFDGKTQTAVFPGDLPEKPDALFANGHTEQQRFVRFKPPKLEKTAEGLSLSLPHIRLDKALEYLIGDKLR